MCNQGWDFEKQQQTDLQGQTDRVTSTWDVLIHDSVTKRRSRKHQQRQRKCEQTHNEIETLQNVVPSKRQREPFSSTPIEQVQAGWAAEASAWSPQASRRRGIWSISPWQLLEGHGLPDLSQSRGRGEERQPRRRSRQRSAQGCYVGSQGNSINTKCSGAAEGVCAHL